SEVASFYKVLQFSARNQHFDKSTTPKPLVTIQRSVITQIEPIVVCAKSYGLQLRVRSNDHDYEDVSYVPSLPFVVIDLINLFVVAIDTTTKTMLIQSGATIGQVYYNVGKSNNTLAFLTRIFLTIGVGGHLSGGGYMTLLCYPRITANHVANVSVIDSNSQIRNRKSLSEDM
ncbi:Tetrahydroberberine oxidase, partial [Linum perenne]